jgi:hypothetical protein
VVFRRDFQKAGKPFRIRLPVGRQLDQNPSQELLQPVGPLQEFSNRRVGLFEPHDMRPVAAELERIAEAFRGLAAPGLEGRGLRQVIKSVVDLDRIEG